VQSAWHDAYRGLQERLSLYIEQARWTVCGLSVCVDAFAALGACDGALQAGPDAARALGAELRRRAAGGIGGEIHIDWPEGSRWVAENLPVRTALGGTAGHAARLLTLLGAPALLALNHRGPEQLARLDPEMLLAADGRATRAADIQPEGPDRPRIYVFEFTAGENIGGVIPPRSSRIIVRFNNLDLERDTAFERLSSRLIAESPGLGAGVLAGFNALGDRPELEAGLDYARSIAARWQAAGIGIIHLEMAGFDTEECRDKMLAGLAGSVTSIGMSLSEFRAIDPACRDLPAGARRLAERLRADRITIHADEWAMSATRGDPAQEREALMMGCLVASARAASGRLIVPTALPDGARFEERPAEENAGGWHVVSCPSPYLARPLTTLGLGDTFMAGCLLVLGQRPLR
jgi:ADP-dependent phosphofructokinase/glucokinase